MADLASPAQAGSPKHGLRSAWRDRWEELVRPSPDLHDVGDRLRARLLSTLLVILVPAGLLSGVIQLATVRGFLPTFAMMGAALTLLVLAYLASRTRHYRWGGAIAAVAPFAACVGVAAQNPDDRAWYAFMIIGVLLASVFLSLRATALVAALAMAAIGVLAAAVPELATADRLYPALMFHLVFSPLLLLAAYHRNRIEAERRRTLVESQARVAEAQRLETVGRLAGGIAHDFNNLLTVVYGNLAELRDAQPAPGPALEEIERAAHRGATLTRDLLVLARKQVLEPTHLDLGGVVGGMRDQLRRIVGPGIEVALELPATPTPVRADRVQLEQVVTALSNNAREAMPDGGRLEVVVGTVTLKRPEAASLRDAPAGAYVELSVADSGGGMNEEIRQRIFEPFFSTKAPGKGTGLGLAAVQGIVQQSGGHVTVESAPGRGSRFRVLLPRAESPAEPAPRRAEAPDVPAPQRKVRILVVDDEEPVRRVMVRVLEQAGYSVAAAGGRQEALEELECGGPVDLLISDMMMPGGPGELLVDELRRPNPQLKVLFVSGIARPAPQTPPDAVGPTAFLPKPFTPAELQAKAEEILAQ